MGSSDETILLLEHRLREAMLSGDVDTLDELIANDLIFIALNGSVVNKSMDLDTHRSGALKLSRLAPSEIQVRNFPGGAVVSVRMATAGTFHGQEFSGDFRYMRVWICREERWQILAGHMCAIDIAT